MHPLRTAIAIAWGVFWIYWLVSAIGVKQAASDRRGVSLPGLSLVSVVLLFGVFGRGNWAVDSPVLAAIGAVLFACGIALAVWARINLGRNWGMPMTEKAEPELVTSGPYRFVRHPIYSGLLLAVFGTALVSNLIGLIVVLILGGYFYYSASVEEKNLAAVFPTAYPAYQSTTKKLIPFVL